jgi:hypothetical protein
VIFQQRDKTANSREQGSDSVDRFVVVGPIAFFAGGLAHGLVPDLTMLERAVVVGLAALGAALVTDLLLRVLWFR